VREGKSQNMPALASGQRRSSKRPGQKKRKGGETNGNGTEGEECQIGKDKMKEIRLETKPGECSRLRQECDLLRRQNEESQLEGQARGIKGAHTRKYNDKGKPQKKEKLHGQRFK